VGKGSEKDHIRPPAIIERENLAETIRQLSAKGLSQRRISDKLNISLGLVNKLVNG